MEAKKLDKKELQYKNLPPAGAKHVFTTPKQDVRMTMKGYSDKTKIFSPASRGI